MTAQQYHKLIEKNIAAYKFGKTPAGLYDPIRYLMSLGGKRLRPMLTLLAGDMFNADRDLALRTGVAIETFHNFTLMHDDIMDQAPLRRGNPTVHTRWNVNTAILSGDVMLVKVYEMLAGLPVEKFAPLIHRFNIVAAEVCEGQQLDMEFETRSDVKEKEYIRMITLKTAVLLGFSLEAGGMMGTAPASDLLALRDCGIAMGIGFQLRDDLLDAYGDPKIFGKQVGGDILANKKTYLLIKALELAKPAQRRALNEWLTKKKFRKQEKIAAVKAIYDDLKIPELTHRKINAYFKKGFHIMQSWSDAGHNTAPLQDFARYLVDRQT